MKKKYLSIVRKICSGIDNQYEKTHLLLSYKKSRLSALLNIYKVRKLNGRKAVDKRLKRKIKAYCKTKFGSKNYWPWIALYTEIRGEFIPGWIPNDYYKFNLLPKMNYNNLGKLSGLKAFDHKLFPDHTLQPILIKVGNAFYDSDLVPLTCAQALEKLKSAEYEVVQKKVMGSGGKGVYFLNPKEIDESVLNKGFDYIIQPVIEQDKTLQSLNKDSLNTFRVYSFLNKEGEVSLLKIFLKVGKAGSRVDNLSSGGDFIPVDKSGYLEKVRYSNWGIVSNTDQVYYTSNKLPYFDKLEEVCISAHRKFPFVHFIGWDIAINKFQEPVIIEWNADHPLFWIYEATKGPFWKVIP
ncbi:sugar-transfer associated ATP-grasp domain-containing protein [Negadavirga shengliensis]|uniref:Sugar-transfer associated ATP-grasp domain-containing protein n=1 Tax=Negadavirga shengliensis TaxID=1389218 RepID=A0ABV9SZ98_9BACT